MGHKQINAESLLSRIEKLKSRMTLAKLPDGMLTKEGSF